MGSLGSTLGWILMSSLTHKSHFPAFGGCLGEREATQQNPRVNCSTTTWLPFECRAGYCNLSKQAVISQFPSEDKFVFGYE